VGAVRIRQIFVVGFAFFLFSSISPKTFGASNQEVILSDAARYFGADVSWKPAEGKLILLSGNTLGQVLIGSKRVLINDYLLMLSSPVQTRDGAVYVSLRDAAAILSRLMGRSVTESEIVTAGLAFDPEASQQIALVDGLRYITYPEFTRFIIGLRDISDVGMVDVQSSENERMLSLVFSNSRFARREPPVEINDGVVGNVEFVQRGTQAELLIKLRTEKITSEIQRFNDPPRIVFDIRPQQATLGAMFTRKESLPQPNGWNEPQPEPARPRSEFTTIVIDPGHGGKDVGARGRAGLFEKDVTFDIALRLKRLIEKKAGMKVVLTRNNDYFVTLEERTVIANTAKDGKPADLFISVHTNSHKSPSVGGFESFYISDTADPSAEATVALENAVIELEKEAKKDTNDSLVPILWDLQFTEFISESSELAFIAQERLNDLLNTRNRGVRQAKFIVLSGVAMPSILIEVGFISNRIEEAKMKTGDFKNKCAEALAEAVFDFKERHDVRLGLLDGKTKR